jgi:molybdate transport system ATP-binding protein
MAREIDVNLTHRFESGVEVAVSLVRSLAPGSILVLFGPSGAGKTTVLRAVAGLMRPDRGHIRLDGRPWFDSEARRFVSPQARRVGYVAQEGALFPHLTVRANVEYGLRGVPADERRPRVESLLQLVGARGWEERRPGELSGGQAQRVMLARALAPAPPLLLLDEPFGALDAATRRELRRELRRLLHETGTAAILVTHDRYEAMAIGDDVAIMLDGRFRQVGPVAEVFRRPADPLVARALGVETVLAGIVERDDRGLVTLRVGAARLTAIADASYDPGEQVFACLRAEDVVVERPGPVADSARNHLAGMVAGIEHEGAVDRLRIDCGFELVAAITSRSREEMALQEGSAVVAAFKATAVHLVRRTGGGSAADAGTLFL